MFHASIITTDPEPIFRSARTPPRGDQFSPAAAERSCRFHRSAGCIIGTSGSRPEHHRVPFVVSRVAMKTPPRSPWTRQHFLPHREPCRWQADKSKCRFLKTPYLLRGEKRIAGSGKGSVGGPDEIKRRDSTCKGSVSDTVRTQKDRSTERPYKSLIFGCGGRICSRTYRPEAQKSRLRLVSGARNRLYLLFVATGIPKVADLN